VLRRLQRVDRADRAVADRGEHVVLIGHQRLGRALSEASGRARFPRPGLDRAAFLCPFLKAAVEHRGIVKAVNAEHPPDACRPLRVGGAVGNDLAVVRDAKAARRGRELGRCRQHKAQLGVACVVGQIGLDIGELRAGNMALFEILAAGLTV
jgi:hypothetical protein